MIPCTDFIPAYSELFSYLHDRGGKAAVEDFWNYISDNFLNNLRELASEQGVRGCWLYWSHTLNEEAADFEMELDEEAGEFRIVMHRCPSMAMLLEQNQIAPYQDYCGHCNVLYRRVLEPLGFDYVHDMSGCRDARCEIVIKARSHS